MKYLREKDCIKILDKKEFNPEHILECGQVFCYEKREEGYVVFPGDKFASIEETKEGYLIKTDSPDYFINWFDLDKNYYEIKSSLSKFKILDKPIQFGYGIRILNQDLFETLISFIISANNNIKRIKLILGNLRRSLGDKKGDYFSFPSYEKLKTCDETFFKKMGAGYRASYLVKVLSQISPEVLEEYKTLSTTSLRTKLIELSGVGPKVADCVLLFGFHCGDVFPVDTWIHQMYNEYFQPLENREVIRNNLVDMFGNLSGYAQQYLFFYQRSYKEV